VRQRDPWMFWGLIVGGVVLLAWLVAYVVIGG
jgi:hypothetical protein